MSVRDIGSDTSRSRHADRSRRLAMSSMNIASRPAASRRLIMHRATLRFAQLVSHLCEELELQFGILLQQLRQLVDRTIDTGRRA